LRVYYGTSCPKGYREEIPDQVRDYVFGSRRDDVSGISFLGLFWFISKLRVHCHSGLDPESHVFEFLDGGSRIKSEMTYLEAVGLAYPVLAFFDCFGLLINSASAVIPGSTRNLMSSRFLTGDPGSSPG